MVYILYENEHNIIDPFEDKIKAHYNKSSVKYLSEPISDNFSKAVSRPPLLDGEWLIITKLKWCDSSIAQLNPESNLVVVKVHNKRELTHAKDVIGSLPYFVIDNYKIDKRVVKAWIGKELCCSERIASYLYDRMSGNLRQIVNSVQQLSILPRVDESSIRQFTQKADNVWIYEIVQYMLGISHNVKYEDILGMLYNFRYSLKWLKKELLSELRVYLNVYLAMDSGDLDLTNYREFKECNTDKSIKACSVYKLKKVIESHSSVSTELVYYFYLRVSSFRNSTFDLCKLVNLIKLGGNDVYSM